MSATMTMKVTLLDAGRLVPHPNNREFPTTGEEWEEFVASIRFHGVQLPILARPHGKDWQIVAGHRRVAAAREAGMLEVPVIVRKMTDKEAMEMVFIDNLHAVDLNPVDEARGVSGLAEVGMSAEQIAARICRDVRWVRTRQGILELGDEVVSAMKLPKEDARHLGVRTVEEILKVPEELRPQAIQLVLHPDFEEGTLSQRQAAEVLQERLVKPWASRVEWEHGREKLAKGWKKRLAAQCLRGKKKELLVVGVPWDDTERVTKGGVPAERKVPLDEQTADAPQFLLWLHLAVRHGMAVRVVHDPAGGQDKSLALVDQRVLIEAEEANAEQLLLAERQLAAAVHDSKHAVIDVDRGDAKRRIPELKALIESLTPWLVTKARGKVSREAAPPSAPAPAASPPPPAPPALTCDRCHEGCEERTRCDTCGKMACASCGDASDDGEDFHCLDCGVVPDFLRKKQESAARVEPVEKKLEEDQEEPPPQPFTIDFRRLFQLEVAALSGEAGLAVECVPEWAKALEPDHVLQVVEWVKSLELQPAE